MSGVVPVRFFTRQHLTVMWPFLLGGSYVLSKFLEFASPSALSEQDKRDSRTSSLSILPLCSAHWDSQGGVAPRPLSPHLGPDRPAPRRLPQAAQVPRNGEPRIP